MMKQNNNNKRNNVSAQMIPSFKSIHKYCKALTPSNLNDPQNRWMDRIFFEKPFIEDQIPLIVLALEARPFFYGRLLEICKALEDLTKEHFSNTQIYVRPFGSTVTNLAFKDSDLDVFLDFNGMSPEPEDKLTITLKKIISKQNRVFKRVIAIQAKVPIVRCIHSSGIQCDISFLNSLGVLNSELISFLLSLDERIRPLLMILKFWMKKQELIGSTFITSYALTLMTIFYLQQLDKPILPSIISLQRCAESKQVVSGWDTSFTKDFTRIPPIDNRMPFLTVLKGFFDYYSTFEFGLYIACPFLGEKLLKTAFVKPELFPPEFQLYMENLRQNPNMRFDHLKFMCVQDPFNHDHNVTRNAPKKIFLSLQDYCLKASKICEEEFKKNRKPQHKSQFFKELFTPINEIKNSKKRKRGSIIEVFMCRDIVMKDGIDSDENGLRHLWCETVLNYFYQILTRVMKCEVEMINLFGNYENSTIYPSEGKVRVYKCVLNHQLLQPKRRTAARQEFDFPKELSVLDKEEMISDYLCDTELQKEEKLELKFSIHSFLKKAPTRISFDIDSLEELEVRKAMVNETYHLMESIVSKYIDMLFEHNNTPQV